MDGWMDGICLVLTMLNSHRKRERKNQPSLQNNVSLQLFFNLNVRSNFLFFFILQNKDQDTL
jgi:hypothetical protein